MPNTILALGIFSDLNYLVSPNKRLLLQCLIILIFLYFFEYRINDLRIHQFEDIFSTSYFKYIFTGGPARKYPNPCRGKPSPIILKYKKNRK